MNNFLGVDSEPILFLHSPLLNAEVDLEFSREHQDKDYNCPGAADPLVCTGNVTLGKATAPELTLLVRNPSSI